MISVVVAAASARAEEALPPWDTAPFKGDAQAIARAVADMPAPKGAEAEILLLERKFQYDDQGREARTTHMVARVLTREGIENWGTVEEAWSLWCEKRPEMHARVITSDGAIHAFDPKSIAEVPVEQEANLLSDQRILRGPLPAVAVGAVVEWETRVEETEPFFKYGKVRRLGQLAYSPMRKQRITIEAPKDFPLQCEARGGSPQPQRRELGDLVQWALETTPAGTLRAWEMCKPHDMAPWPEIAFSTGQSWQQIASQYAAIVEQQIDVASVESLARATVGEEKDPRKAAAKLLAYVNNLVRYTGVEFGHAAVVPRNPTETLARRFGDCKDQAALMVAMLRSVGVTAYVALLKAGHDADTIESLPGLSAFNHAIVYASIGDGLWIDPTDRYLPVGELPTADQGRRALVASPDTRGLVQIPVADYRRNFARDIYEVQLAAGGKGRLVESTYMTGSFADAARYRHAMQSEVDRRKGIRAYGRSKHYADELLSYEHSPPDELTKPFEMRLEFGKAQLGQVDDTHAYYQIYPGEVLELLPPLLKQARGSEDERESREGLAPPIQRQSPLELPTPYIREVVYRVTPPKGLSLLVMPESSVKRFGPATLTQDFRREGSTLVATFRLDTGSGRFAPREVDAFRQGLAELGTGGDVSRWEVRLRFGNVASPLAGGDLKQAVLESLRQVERDPGSATLQIQFSKMLLAAGLSEPAREAAERAVELTPNSAEAQAQLGLACTFDTVGRQYRPGMDWTQAQTSYRKSLGLAPDNGDIRWRYAILLEHNGAGLRYYFATQLDEAIFEHRKIKLDAQLDAKVVNGSLVMALMHRNRYSDIRELAQKHPGDLFWDPVGVAILAVEKGPTAAREKAQALAPGDSDRRKLLQEAAQLLIEGRLYKQSADLLQAPGEPAPSSSEPGLDPKVVRALRRIDVLSLTNSSPSNLVEKLLATLLVKGKQDPTVRELFTQDASDADYIAAVEEAWKAVRELRLTLIDKFFSTVRLADCLGLVHLSTVGEDASGHAVQAMGLGAPFTCYVIKEPSGYRLLPPGQKQSRLGINALACLQRGNQVAAKNWLSRAYAQHKKEVGWFDPMSGSPFGRLWYSAAAPDEAWLYLSAAALAAEGFNPQPVVSLLNAARTRNLPEATAIQVDRALAKAGTTLGRPEMTLSAVDRVLARKRNSPELLVQHVHALYLSNKMSDGRQLLKTAAAKTFANDPAGQEALALCASAIGDLSLENEILNRLIPRGRLSATGYNELAWNALIQRASTREALELATKAVDLTRNMDPSCLHTLATLHAEEGQVEQAIRALHRAIELRGYVVDQYDCYVLGRVAEHCGLNRWALKYYQRITRPASLAVNDIYHLVQRRMDQVRKAVDNGSSRF